MKKFCLLLAMCGSLAGNLYAQEFYTRLGIGYGTSVGSKLHGTATPSSVMEGFFYSNPTLDTQKYKSFDVKNSSFSKGFHAVVAGGYMFNKHIGVDLLFDFGMSGTKTVYKENDMVIDNRAYSFTVEQYAPTPVLFNPSIVLQQQQGKLAYYGRAGVVVALSAPVLQDVIFYDSVNQNSNNYRWKIEHNFSLGFSLAAGAKLQIGKKVKLWGEVGYTQLNAINRRATMIRWAYDGGDIESALPDSDKQIIYGSAGKDNYHQPSFKQPFSNLAFSIGFSFDLDDYSEANPQTKAK